jgi:hypothetical protein
MAFGHPAAVPPERLLAECDETRTRRGGPGGQHRNKVETAVVLRHRPTGLTAEAAERRSQAENRRVALGRLRLRLALEHRTPPDAAGPSPLWRSRSRGGRLVIAADHDDHPALVAEALDHLRAAEFDVAATAKALGVSGSQLTRLFRLVPKALAVVNGCRRDRDLPPLK